MNVSKLGPISHFLSPSVMWFVSLKGLRCEWGAGVLNMMLSLSISHTGHWKFNMAAHGKELYEDLKKSIVALHKDGVGYKRRLPKPWNWAAAWWPYSGLTGQVPKKLSARAQRHIQRLCLGNRCMSAASIAAEVVVGGGSACQCSDHSNWSAWLSS